MRLAGVDLHAGDRVGLVAIEPEAFQRDDCQSEGFALADDPDRNTQRVEPLVLIPAVSCQIV
ncbi:MAG: hypothetical protein V3W36_03615, partial [Acidimicrobiia bacterium]